MTIDELKSLLSQYNIKPTKKLGQNFLLSDEVLDQIVKAADITPSDTILEIGPGLGVLTRRLGERAELVLAVEKDHKVARVLHRLFRSKKNVKIIQGDALFLKPSDYQLQANSYKLVANIPYYITGKLLRNFLSSASKPKLMVLMLQSEVAHRIVSKPGEMSILSVSVQFYSDVEIVADVPKENFYPVPKVDSAVVRFDVYPDQLLQQKWGGVDENKFFQLVKVGFSNKRKMLANNLKTIYKGQVKEVLEEVGLNTKARAQDLSLDDWKKLYDRIFI